MQFILERDYFGDGTNGDLFFQKALLCHTIELPWHDNEPAISCIPEGTYPLIKRYSEKFGWHLALKNVPRRDDILIHPANDALTELQGCIAPVSKLTDPGKGIQSRVAFEQLKAIVYEASARKEPIFITIQSAINADQKDLANIPIQ